MTEAPGALQLADRAYSLKNSRLLPRRHDVLRHLDAVETVGFQLSHRSSSRDPVKSGELSLRLTEEAHAADRSIAASLLANDSVGDFLSVFGERSLAGPLRPDVAGCPCGLPAAVYNRTGLLDMVPDTLQVICDRCGDIENAIQGAPTVRMRGPRKIVRGADVEFDIEVTAREAGLTVVGVGLRRSLHAEIVPAPQVVSLSRGESRRVAFRLCAFPSTRAQAEYALPFAVAGMLFSVGRFHLDVH